MTIKLAHAKTITGNSVLGLDFLGYRNAKHNERKAAVYEQGASDQRILAYVQQWQKAFGLWNTIAACGI
ncbi:MAG: hypothetical protein NTV32_01550 [Gammaproteobacteria bacterium]|nr:hypothetical protein [Gammaproteobacteria bacterium]